MSQRQEEGQQELSDVVLLQQALDGDQRAFERLVQRYYWPLFQVSRRYLMEEEQVYDLLQNVFLQLYLSLSSLHPGKPLRPWLVQVARNRCLDELRRRRAIPLSLLEQDGEDEENAVDLADKSPSPQELLEQQEVQQRLVDAIQSLPTKYRLVVALRYVRQLSFSEIGCLLHVSEDTAKTRFYRARPLLQLALQEERATGER